MDFPMMVGFGMLELIVVLLGGSFSGGELMGLPPGPRDAALVRAAAPDSVLYFEWAARGTGKEGAAGIDGFVADPEVRAFFQHVDETIAAATGGDQPEPGTVEAAAYPLAKLALLQPGCLFVRLDPESMPKDGPPGAGLLKGIQFALVVSGGDAADELNTAAANVVRLLIEAEDQVELKMTPLPNLIPGFEPVAHRHGSHILLADSKATAERVVAGLSGKTDGMAKHERYQAALRSVAFDRTGAITWLDVSGLIAKLGEGLGVQGVLVKSIAATVGIDGIESIASATGVADGQIRTRTFIRTGGKTNGVLAFTTGRGIQPADVAHIPADADLALGWSVSLSKVATEVRKVVGQADPNSLRSLEAILKQLDEDLGVSIEKDLLPSLGDVSTVHNSPSGGGFLVSGPVLAVELRDAGKASEAVTRLLNAADRAIKAQGVGDAESNLQEHEFLGHTITCLRIPGPEPMVLPVFCLTKSHLYVALHPQTLKGQLRFLAAKRPGYDTLLGRSIPVSDGDLLAFQCVDARPLVRMIYAAVPYWATIVERELERQGIEFDPFTVPSAEGVLPYVTPSISTTVRTPDGLLQDRRGGAPLLGGLSFLPAVFLSGRHVEAHEFNAPVPR